MTAIITDLTLPSGVQVSGQAITGSISFNGTTQFLSTTTSGLDNTNSTPLGGSIYFNGTNDSTVSYSGSSLDLGTSAPDWTMECWYYAIEYPNGWGPIFQQGWNIGTTNPIYGFMPSSTNIYYYVGTGAVTSNAIVTPFSVKTWYHLAQVRKGNAIGCYLNGVLVGSYTLTFTMGSSTSLIFSAANNGSAPANAYVNNVRIVKGQAVYSFTYTPPTTALTAVTNTQLLVDVASSGAYLTDGSTNNYTLTPTGTVTYNASTPVSSGGSLFFDQTTISYLTLPSSSTSFNLTGDFTIQAWIKMTTLLGGTNGIFDARASGGTAAPWVFFINGAGKLSFFTGSYYTGATTISTGVWTQVAVVRSGSTLTLYVNGIADYTNTSFGTAAINPGTTSALIGTKDYSINAQYRTIDYITNLRIVNGTAIYDSPNFTPSTLPLPSTQSANIYGSPSSAITGTQTSLLLNTPIGAGFLTDSSSFNNTPTNGGNATSTSNTLFYSSPFTVELWWNPSGAGQANGKIFQTANGDSYTYISLTLDGTGNNLLVYMSNTSQSWNLVNGTSFTLTTGTWYHLALVYDGTTIKLYVNGVGTTLATVTTYINPVGTTVIGGQTNGKNAYGLISNVRVMNGIAVYTSDFTPPSGPLSITQTSNQNGSPSSATNNITSTNLMLNTINDSSYLTDSSYYKNTITANASPSSSAINPFTNLMPASIQYLVVAGGGGGGAGSGNGTGGGGGAGGLVEGTASVTSGYTITVTVGSGGAPASSGVNSSLTLPASVVALGGGRGGSTTEAGYTGGSGGGGGGNQFYGGQPGAAALQPGSASGGYGNSGGNGTDYQGGGGGGAAAAGGSTPGQGGNGREWPTGSGTYYAGGGAGTIGAGGLGGGGSNGVSGPNGVANTGGGGAGGPSGTGGSGGSGVVIIRYPDSYMAASATTGSPTITYASGYRIYTFNNSGSITF